MPIKIPTFEELLKKVKQPKLPTVSDRITGVFDAPKLGITPPAGWKPLGDGSLLSPRGLTFKNLKLEGGKITDFQVFRGDRQVRPIPLTSTAATAPFPGIEEAQRIGGQALRPSPMGQPKPESKSFLKTLKDAWDLASITGVEKSKQAFLNVIPKLLIPEPVPISKRPPEQQLYYQQHPEIRAQVEKEMQISQNIRETTERIATESQKDYEKWVGQHPELAPNPKYEAGPFEYPELLKDPKWWGYEVASALPITLTAMGAGALTTIATGGNVLAGAVAAGVTFAPVEMQGVYDDLISEGISPQQASELAAIVTVPIVLTESAGSLLQVSRFAPQIKSIFRKEATKQIIKLTKRQLLKKGLATFTTVQFSETMEEIIQQALGNTAVIMAGKDRSVFKGVPEMLPKVTAATLPLSLIGGGVSTLNVSPGLKAPVSEAMKEAAEEARLRPERGAIGGEGEVRADTRLTIGGMQGQRLALKEAGITFETTNPTIQEIVTKLDEIDNRLTTIPKRNVKQISQLQNGREVLVNQAKIQSGFDEAGLRNIVIPKEVTPEYWKMTKQEIYDKAKELLTPGAGGRPFTAERTALLNKQVDYHKTLVQQALSAGKPVPADVLKDYPDLKPVTPEVTPAPEVTPPVTEGVRLTDYQENIRDVDNTIQATFSPREGVNVNIRTRRRFGKDVPDNTPEFLPQDFDIKKESALVNETINEVDDALETPNMRRAILDAFHTEMKGRPTSKASVGIILTDESKDVGMGSAGEGSAKVFWSPYSNRALYEKGKSKYGSLGVDPIAVLAHEYHHALGGAGELDIFSDAIGARIHLRHNLELIDPAYIKEWIWSNVGAIARSPKSRRGLEAREALGFAREGNPVLFDKLLNETGYSADALTKAKEQIAITTRKWAKVEAEVTPPVTEGVRATKSFEVTVTQGTIKPKGGVEAPFERTFTVQAKTASAAVKSVRDSGVKADKIDVREVTKPAVPPVTEGVRLSPSLVEQWRSADPSKGIGLGRLGTVGEIITDPKTLQHFDAVKDVEIYVADIMPRGSWGEHHTNVEGKPVIYIDPRATEKTLWEEIIHADRAAKGRPMGEVAEPSAKVGREYFIKPSELNKELKEAGFSQGELEALPKAPEVTPPVTEVAPEATQAKISPVKEANGKPVVEKPPAPQEVVTPTSVEELPPEPPAPPKPSVVTKPPVGVNAPSGKKPPPNSPLGTIEGMWSKGRKPVKGKPKDAYLKAQEYGNDIFYGIRQIQGRVAKGQPIVPGGANDVVTLLTRAPGAANAGATRYILHIDQLKKIAPNTNADDINTILYAEHAKEILAQKGGERVMAGGFKTQAALDDALAQLQSKLGTIGYQEANAAAVYVKNVYTTELQRMVNEGLVSEELATELREKYPWYNPLQYIDDVEELTAQGKSVKPFSVISSGIKRLSEKGTSKEAVAPLNLLGDQLIRNEVRIVKNQTAKAIIDLAIKDNLVVTKISGVRPVASVEGQPIFRRTYEDIPGTLSFFEGGIRQIYQVPDFIYREANVLTKVISNPVSSLIGAMNGVSRAAFTTFSPPFVVSNILNDMLTAFVTRGIMPQQTVARLIKSVKSLENDKVMQSFRLAGGYQQRFYGRSAQSIAKEVGVTGGGVIKSSPAFLKKVMRAIPAAGEAGEQAPRIALFQRELNKNLPNWKNMTVEEIAATPEGRKAAAGAVELTINFGRGGYLIKAANPYIIFINASFEGAKLPFRSLRDNPAARWRLAAVAAVTIGLVAYNLSYPEYMDIPDYRRWGSVIIMLPPKKKNPDGTNVPNYVTIVPRTREWGMLLGTLAYAQEKMFADDPASYGRFAAAMAPMLSPISETPIPQVMSELVQQEANWDFYRSRPIISESLQNLPTEEQTTPYISRTVEVGANAVNVSPVRAQHAVSGIFGGASQSLTSITDVIANLLMPEVVSQEIVDLAERYQALPIKKTAPDTVTKSDFLKRINASDKRKMLNYINRLPQELPVIDSVIRRIKPGYGGQLESNLYDLEQSVKVLPSYWANSMTPEQMREVDTDFWTKRKAADARIIDQYDLAMIGKTNSERESWLKDNPSVEAIMLLQGTRTGINSIEAARKLEEEANKVGIPIDLIPAFSLTDKGKERIPSNRALWEPYFTYYDLPGSGGYLSLNQAAVDAGRLPEEYREQWEKYQTLKTDKAKTLYRKQNKKLTVNLREELRRENEEFDQWLIDQKDMKPLDPIKRTISRTGRISPVSAFGGTGAGAVRPRQTKVTYPKFKAPRISRGISVRAPSAPGV